MHENINEIEKNNTIPATGRIGRFIAILEKNATQEDFMQIAEGACDYSGMRPAQKAVWWKQTVERMLDKLGRDKSKEIMAACGAKCCGSGHRKSARRIMEESKSIEDFLTRLEALGKTSGDLSYMLTEDGKIIAKYNKCFCGQVKNSPEMHKTFTYCQCSAEFNRNFFSAAFGKDVKVEIKKSILCGDRCCEFEIEV